MAKFTRYTDGAPVWVNPPQVFDVAPYTNSGGDGSVGPTAIVGAGNALTVVKESAQNVALALGL